VEHKIIFDFVSGVNDGFAFQSIVEFDVFDVVVVVEYCELE
jgi:hypothetical protein